ncbi:MAG: hypothetical protein ABWY25_10980 [Paenisporosarcina sp.]
MAPKKDVPKKSRSKSRRPATTSEGREGQLVALAVDLAEEQLAEGTASAQVISHYLKLGSTREVLEQERLAQENELLKAKVDQLASGKRIEELYEEALDAMRSYAGQIVHESDD